MSGPPPPEVVGAVLAGGESRRMGRDKATLRLPDGPTMTERVVTALDPHVAAIAVVGGPTVAVPAGTVHLEDPEGPRGPLAGVDAALRWGAGTGAARVVVLPCDLPWIAPDDVAPLLAAGPQEVAVAAVDGRRHLVAAVWPVLLGPAVADARSAGVASLRAMLGRLPASFTVRDVPAGPGLRDADRPGDLGETR